MTHRKRNRLVLLLVSVLALGSFCYLAERFEPNTQEETLEPYCYVDAIENVEETKIVVQEENGQNHLFLPSNIDISRLKINFNCPKGERILFLGEEVVGEITIDVTSQGKYRKKKNAYELNFEIYGQSDLAKEYQIFVMASENIPSVYLCSEDMEKNRAWIESTPDHSNVASGYLYMVHENGALICKQRADRIRVRGNFTASARKKAYQVKLQSKEDLLEIEEPRKNWALLANAYDTTLQHNTLTYQLGKELGLSDSPDCSPVDVYYDGEYVGNYLLTETPEISNSSVAIEEAGSYLMQIDYSHYMEREHYLELSNGMYVTLEEPRKCDEEQLSYVNNLWEELIDTINNGGIHPVTGKYAEDYLDVDSYARYYLVQQFSKNPDGFSSSTYCYIPQGEDKIYFCALWDFDLCYGVDKQLQELTDPEGFYPDNVGSDISNLPVIQQRIKEIYDKEFRILVEEILLGEEDIQGNYIKSLSGYNKEILASSKMNYTIWDFNQTGVTIPYGSHEKSIVDFHEFVRKRHEWLSKTLDGWVGCDVIDEIAFHIEEPIAGMPIIEEASLSNKWCGVKILSTEIMEQEPYFEQEKEYHYRIRIRNQHGTKLGESVNVTSDIGTVEEVRTIADGELEVLINTGVPKITGTVYEGMNYAPVYNKEYYLQQYPEVVELVGTSDDEVIRYFVTEGMKQAHQGCEDFDVKVYIARYTPLFDQSEYPDVYMHYLTEGIYQEWSGKL